MTWGASSTRKKLTLLNWKESIEKYGNAVFAQQSKLFGVLDAPLYFIAFSSSVIV